MVKKTTDQQLRQSIKRSMNEESFLSPQLDVKLIKLCYCRTSFTSVSLLNSFVCNLAFVG